jgi:hypothetical protein
VDALLNLAMCELGHGLGQNLALSVAELGEPFATP